MASRSLQIERHPKIPLRQWYAQRASIDFDPPYQRKGGIWSVADQALLIDTIINGFDIPKFYVSDFGRGSELSSSINFVYAVIDGKQRFQAIFSFMNNKLPLNENFIWRYDEKLPLGGLYYREIVELYPKIADLIDNFIIDVMSVSTDDPEDINKIFKRLNKGKSLTGAEVRNAALGPVADMIRVVGKHDFFQESVSFDTLRLGDQNAAAKVLLFEYKGYPTSTKKKDLDLFSNEDSPSRDMIEAAGLKCLSHLDLMYQAFGQRDAVLRSAGQVPVYYWLIRSLPRDVHGYVRSFLYAFDKDRNNNRRLQTENRLNEVDQTLARYDVLNRNTNDAGSHRARIAILMANFATWLRKVHPRKGDLADMVDEASISFNEYIRREFGHDWFGETI